MVWRDFARMAAGQLLGILALLYFYASVSTDGKKKRGKAKHEWKVGR